MNPLFELAYEIARSWWVNLYLYFFYQSIIIVAAFVAFVAFIGLSDYVLF